MAQAHAEEALKVFTALRHRHLWEVRECLGWIAEFRGEYDIAKEHYEEGLKLVRPPLDCGLLVNLGDLYGKLGEFKKARDYLQRGYNHALGARPQIATKALSILGSLNVVLGDYPRARAYFEKVVSTPRYGGPGRAVAYCGLASCVEGLGDIDRAQKTQPTTGARLRRTGSLTSPARRLGGDPPRSWVGTRSRGAT